MAIILSTATDGIDFTFYNKTPGGLNQVVKTISINGGSNRVDPRTLITPQGVSTSLSEDDLELLKTHPLFQKMVDDGFLKICYDGKEKTDDMETKDKAAQLTASDYEKKGKKAPKGKK